MSNKEGDLSTVFLRLLDGQCYSKMVNEHVAAKHVVRAQVLAKYLYMSRGKLGIEGTDVRPMGSDLPVRLCADCSISQLSQRRPSWHSIFCHSSIHSVEFICGWHHTMCVAPLGA